MNIAAGTARKAITAKSSIDVKFFSRGNRLPRHGFLRFSVADEYIEIFSGGVSAAVVFFFFRR